MGESNTLYSTSSNLPGCAAEAYGGASQASSYFETEGRLRRDEFEQEVQVR